MSQTEVTASPFEYRVVARNSAASSANVIHADEGGLDAAVDVAGQHGQGDLLMVLGGLRKVPWTGYARGVYRQGRPVHEGLAVAELLRVAVREYGHVRTTVGHAEAVAGGARAAGAMTWRRAGRRQAMSVAGVRP